MLLSTRHSPSWGTHSRQEGWLARNGGRFIGFSPAVSAAAVATMGAEVRRWRLHLKTGHNLGELAAWINPIVAGWMNYYGRFYRSRLYPLLQRINSYLMRWARRKYKRLSGYRRVKAWWNGVVERDPELFTHLAMDAHGSGIAVRRAE